MSMAILLNGTLATDSQMLLNINERDEYIDFGKKLFISPCKRAAIAVVGSEWDAIELALVWTFVVGRLTAFYLSYDAGNPLEFSDDELALLGGTSSMQDYVSRRFFLVTNEHAWAVKRDSDKGAIVSPIDPTGWWSQGSESNISNVFYKAGFDAEEIIRRVARLANTCGGEVQSLRMAELKPFDREVPKKRTVRKPQGTK